jgi:hypothetical protein
VLLKKGVLLFLDLLLHKLAELEAKVPTDLFRDCQGKILQLLWKEAQLGLGPRSYDAIRRRQAARQGHHGRGRTRGTRCKARGSGSRSGSTSNRRRGHRRKTPITIAALPLFRGACRE